MLESLKNMFTFTEDQTIRKKEFFGLTKEIEETIENGGICPGEGCKCESVVDSAVRIRNMLLGEKLQLRRSDKIRLLKAINRAKVRALLSGTLEGKRTYNNLESISGEVVQLL